LLAGIWELRNMMLIMMLSGVFFNYIIVLISSSSSLLDRGLVGVSRFRQLSFESVFKQDTIFIIIINNSCRVINKCQD
jgi:hypothetical protein